MRSQILKLKRDNSTKEERRVGELLKRNRMRFKTKWRIGPYEADFVIGRVAVECDGSIHQKTDTQKDIYFASQGYVTLHLSRLGKESDLISIIKSNNKNGKRYR